MWERRVVAIVRRTNVSLLPSSGDNLWERRVVSIVGRTNAPLLPFLTNGKLWRSIHRDDTSLPHVAGVVGGRAQWEGERYIATGRRSHIRFGAPTLDLVLPH